jgi:hypothetical protein
MLARIIVKPRLGQKCADGEDIVSLEVVDFALDNGERTLLGVITGLRRRLLSLRYHLGTLYSPGFAGRVLEYEARRLPPPGLNFYRGQLQRDGTPNLPTRKACDTFCR